MNFSAAAGTPQGTTIHTSPQGLTHGLIDLPVQDGSVPAYYAAPEGKTDIPIVAVVQEIFGIHEHIQDVCRRLAKEGYFAIAVNLYERQGDASAYTDIPKLIQDIVAKVPDEQVMSDLDASVAWAAQHGGDDSRVGVTGFCWGGRITWMYTAHSAKVKAGVAWYGKLTTGHGPLIKRHPVEVARELHGPVLGLYGAQDNSIPLADVETMKQRLADGNAHAQASQIVVYPDSGHAFFADYRPSYNEKDARDGWQKAIDWFAKYLK
jgi:carboxymethylenebutenolidase